MGVVFLAGKVVCRSEKDDIRQQVGSHFTLNRVF